MLEALKDQEQARRKKVGNTRCIRRLRKFPGRHRTGDLFVCGPAGHRGSSLGSREPLAFHAGSQTEPRSIPGLGLGSAVVEVV